ncbi:hypothetical protein H7992_13495 [Sporosarcina sp. resist]|uniref:hypothetical protein n=1 Tax=Sporosarcina sp. resist TaxID=2762563 RepID=UPI00164EB490|nr:hypothetical protein [Sporosarcina sp. resist]QNK86282.1 hypothetical protein H7992_13495 [Sporosarcina sp. resist]
MQAHERLITILRSAILSNVRKGRFLIGGVERDFDVFGTEILGNIIRVKFYLDEFEGPVTHASLLDHDYVMLVSGNVNFSKEDDGFMYVFDVPVISGEVVKP